MPEARCNPGAAKASDCEISKSFCAVARCCYEAEPALKAPLIDVYSGAETHRLRCGGVVPRVSVDPNCGIRIECSLIALWLPSIFSAPIKTLPLIPCPIPGK